MVVQWHNRPCRGSLCLARSHTSWTQSATLGFTAPPPASSSLYLYAHFFFLGCCQVSLPHWLYLNFNFCFCSTITMPGLFASSYSPAWSWLKTTFISGSIRTSRTGTVPIHYTSQMVIPLSAHYPTWHLTPCCNKPGPWVLAAVMEPCLCGFGAQSLFQHCLLLVSEQSGRLAFSCLWYNFLILATSSVCQQNLVFLSSSSRKTYLPDKLMDAPCFTLDLVSDTH